MKIGVLGSRGYLGSEIVKILSTNNSVFPLPRDWVPASTDFDLVIDASFPRDYLKRNVQKTYILDLENRLSQCQSYNISYYYLATMSDSRSIYGDFKRKCQELVTFNRGINIYFGLVLSKVRPGGRLKELSNILNTLHFDILFNQRLCPVIITMFDDFDYVIRALSPKFDNNLDIYCRTIATNWNEVVRFISKNRFSVTLPLNFTLLIFNLLRFLNLKYFDNFKSIATKMEETYVVSKLAI